MFWSGETCQGPLRRRSASPCTRDNVMLTGALLAGVEGRLFVAVIGVSLRANTFTGRCVCCEAPAQGFSPLSNRCASLSLICGSPSCAPGTSLLSAACAATVPPGRQRPSFHSAHSVCAGEKFLCKTFCFVSLLHRKPRLGFMARVWLQVWVRTALTHVVCCRSSTASGMVRRCPAGFSSGTLAIGTLSYCCRSEEVGDDARPPPSVAVLSTQVVRSLSAASRCLPGL